jgi:hypothetical protein
MTKTFFLPKYYTIEIEDQTGEVKVYSNSKHAKGRELTKKINSYGYLDIKMNNKTYTIHSLVAKYFLGERPKDLCINHIDGNKFNNAPSNLEYVTITENIKHSIKTGLHICNTPEKMGRYIDGRCKDKVKYKREWYLKNKQRILEKMKKNYNDNKQQPTKNKTQKTLL